MSFNFLFKNIRYQISRSIRTNCAIEFHDNKSDMFTIVPLAMLSTNRRHKIIKTTINEIMGNEPRTKQFLNFMFLTISALL